MEISGIPVRVIRKDIKNMRLSVSPDGHVRISAPIRLSDERITWFVRTKINWIKKQQEKFEKQPRQLLQQFVSGEPFYILGKLYYLKVVDNHQTSSLELSGDQAILTVSQEKTAEQRESFINEWYRSLLKAEIAKYMPKWENITGLHCRSWQIKNMTSRWGSCNTKTGKIWLSLQLVKKPVECLEYIILHELAHLRIRNHGADFNAILDNHMPCWRELRDQLSETHKPISDLVVDGSKPAEEIADEIITYINTRCHYDALIDENNDPVHDPGPLKTYMDKWDGEAFIEELRLSPDKSVLEIGVGTGRLATRVCGKCRHFKGIDLSSKTVERAKENLRSFSNVNLICGDFLFHPFGEKFNIIYSSLTFMHIKDKRAAILKAASLLKPGGRFILSISKDQQPEIDYGSRRITVYPDKPEEINTLISNEKLILEKQFETEFAVIFTATKEG